MRDQDLRKFLDENEFVSAGKLDICEGGWLRYTSEHKHSQPSVYVIVRSGEGESAVVLYVGMASKGWQARSKQHNGGLKSVSEEPASKGLEDRSRHEENYSEWKECLKSGETILVYERTSKQIELFGQMVAIHHAEEQALIHLLSPRHNVLGQLADRLDATTIVPMQEAQAGS